MRPKDRIGDSPGSGPPPARSSAFVRLADVADHAGVSLSTASRVLSYDSPPGRPDVRRRVLASADALGYVPNPHARALATANSATVGLVVHDLRDSYFALVAGGVIRVANEHGLFVTIHCTFRDPVQELRYVGMLRAQRARAVILAGSGFEDRAHIKVMSAALSAYTESGGAVVLISRHRFPGDAVLVDNRQGAAEMARHLADLGHQRFGVVAGPARLTTVRDRLTGFRQGLASRQLELPDSLVVRDDFSRDGGYRAASRLLASAPEITCLFAVNDVMAVGALAAAREAGIAVPGQLSLAGFGDVPIAQDVTPALTTVRLPLEQIGAEAMQLALNANRTARPRTVVLGYQLQIRGSTSAPPAAAR